MADANAGDIGEKIPQDAVSSISPREWREIEKSPLLSPYDPFGAISV
jgi:hypothetical protein